MCSPLHLRTADLKGEGRRIFRLQMLLDSTPPHTHTPCSELLALLLNRVRVVGFLTPNKLSTGLSCACHKNPRHLQFHGNPNRNPTCLMWKTIIVTADSLPWIKQCSSSVSIFKISSFVFKQVPTSDKT